MIGLTVVLTVGLLQATSAFYIDFNDGYLQEQEINIINRPFLNPYNPTQILSLPSGHKPRRHLNPPTQPGLVPPLPPPTLPMPPQWTLQASAPLPAGPPVPIQPPTPKQPEPQLPPTPTQPKDVPTQPVKPIVETKPQPNPHPAPIPNQQPIPQPPKPSFAVITPKTPSTSKLIPQILPNPIGPPEPNNPPTISQPKKESPQITPVQQPAITANLPVAIQHPQVQSQPKPRPQASLKLNPVSNHPPTIKSRSVINEPKSMFTNVVNAKPCNGVCIPGPIEPHHLAGLKNFKPKVPVGLRPPKPLPCNGLCVPFESDHSSVSQKPPPIQKSGLEDRPSSVPLLSKAKIVMEDKTVIAAKLASKLTIPSSPLKRTTSVRSKSVLHALSPKKSVKRLQSSHRQHDPRRRIAGKTIVSLPRVIIPARQRPLSVRPLPRPPKLPTIIEEHEPVLVGNQNAALQNVTQNDLLHMTSSQRQIRKDGLPKIVTSPPSEKNNYIKTTIPNTSKIIKVAVHQPIDNRTIVVQTQPMTNRSVVQQMPDGAIHQDVIVPQGFFVQQNHLSPIPVQQSRLPIQQLQHLKPIPLEQKLPQQVSRHQNSTQFGRPLQHKGINKNSHLSPKGNSHLPQKSRLQQVAAQQGIAKQVVSERNSPRQGPLSLQRHAQQANNKPPSAKPKEDAHQILPKLIPQQDRLQEGPQKQGLTQQGIPEQGILQQGPPQQNPLQQHDKQQVVPQRASTRTVIPQQNLPQQGLTHQVPFHEDHLQQGLKQPSLPIQGSPKHDSPQHSLPHQIPPKQSLLQQSVIQQGLRKQASLQQKTAQPGTPQTEFIKQGFLQKPLLLQGPSQKSLSRQESPKQAPAQKEPQQQQIPSQNGPLEQRIPQLGQVYQGPQQERPPDQRLLQQGYPQQGPEQHGPPQQGPSPQERIQQQGPILLGLAQQGPQQRTPQQGPYLQERIQPQRPILQEFPQQGPPQQQIQPPGPIEQGLPAQNILQRANPQIGPIQQQGLQQFGWGPQQVSPQQGFAPIPRGFLSRAPTLRFPPPQHGSPQSIPPNFISQQPSPFPQTTQFMPPGQYAPYNPLPNRPSVFNGVPHQIPPTHSVPPNFNIPPHSYPIFNFPRQQNPNANNNLRPLQNTPNQLPNPVRPAPPNNPLPPQFIPATGIPGQIPAPNTLPNNLTQLH